MGDRRLGGKLFAILAKTRDAAALSHPPRPNLRATEVLHVPVVTRAELPGNEDFDRATHDLRRGVAEDLLGSVVEERDSLGVVDADDGIRRYGDDARNHLVGYWITRREVHRQKKVIGILQ